MCNQKKWVGELDLERNKMEIHVCDYDGMCVRVGV